MKKLIIPAIGLLLLLIAIGIAVISSDQYWLYMLIGGTSIGILLGSFLSERTRKRLS
jgi:hypothetical protein